jgi:hypothetical protein
MAGAAIRQGEADHLRLHANLHSVARCRIGVAVALPGESTPSNAVKSGRRRATAPDARNRNVGRAQARRSRSRLRRRNRRPARRRAPEVRRQRARIRLRISQRRRLELERNPGVGDVGRVDPEDPAASSLATRTLPVHPACGSQRITCSMCASGITPTSTGESPRSRTRVDPSPLGGPATQHDAACGRKRSRRRIGTAPPTRCLNAEAARR